MSRITDVASATQSTTQTQAKSNGYGDLDLDQFLKLLVTELQNQDPLEPTKNSEIVQQVGQIRSIGATDSLTNTLSNLSQNQELVTASGLIGQKVEGLADDSSPVDGVVDRITVVTDTDRNSRSVKVHVGNQTLDINNIRTILNN